MGGGCVRAGPSRETILLVGHRSANKPEPGDLIRVPIRPPFLLVGHRSATVRVYGEGGLADVTVLKSHRSSYTGVSVTG